MRAAITEKSRPGSIVVLDGGLSLTTIPQGCDGEQRFRTDGRVSRRSQ